MTIDIAAIKARRAAITPGPWNLVPAALGWAWIFDADGERIASVPFRGNAAFIATAPADIDALLAEVERLQTAIRNAETLSEVTHLVGPSETENEEARRRLEQMDGINAKYGVDIAKWPDHVYMKWTRLNITQGAFERRYT